MSETNFLICTLLSYQFQWVSSVSHHTLPAGLHNYAPAFVHPPIHVMSIGGAQVHKLYCCHTLEKLLVNFTNNEKEMARNIELNMNIWSPGLTAKSSPNLKWKSGLFQLKETCIDWSWNMSVPLFSLKMCTNNVFSQGVSIKITLKILIWTMA